LLISGIKSSPVLDCIKVAINGENHLVLNSILSLLAEAKINIWFEVQVKNSNDLIGDRKGDNPIFSCQVKKGTERGTVISI